MKLHDFRWRNAGRLLPRAHMTTTDLERDIAAGVVFGCAAENGELLGCQAVKDIGVILHARVRTRMKRPDHPLNRSGTPGCATDNHTPR